jgi:hypothetical protein
MGGFVRLCEKRCMQGVSDFYFIPGRYLEDPVRRSRTLSLERVLVDILDFGVQQGMRLYLCYQ